MAATNSNAINYFSPAKWVVSTVAGEGTHTTLAAALAVASTGDTIVMMPGTYTANTTIGIACNIAAFTGDGLGNVTINGTLTVTAAITVELSNLFLETNSAALLAVTGSAASVVNLNNCYLNCSNNTGISLSSSGAGSTINIINCVGALGTTGIAYFSATNGNIFLQNSIFNNLGASTTANTFSGAQLTIINSYVSNPVTTSGSTAELICRFSTIDCSVINVSAINSNSTVVSPSSAFLENSILKSGSATPLTIGAASSVTASILTLSSTNATAVSGSGSLTYGVISQEGTIGTLSATTLVAKGTIGNQAGTAPAAGYLGEIKQTLISSPVSVSVNTITNIGSLTLTPGVWDVNGIISYSIGSGVALIAVEGVLATGVSNFTPIDQSPSCGSQNLPTTLAAQSPTVNLGPSRVTITAGTTYYLNAYVSATSATASATGFIRAARVG